jgi:putative secretion ATPase (PEP-CTERM system associated)
MYERFYNLRERPFALSPDPEYLYPSRVHQEALDYLRYGLESQAGFIVITGEIGSGKTTLLQALLRNLDNQTTVGRIVNTMLDPRELLESIMIDFGLDPGGRSKPLLVRDLSQYLVEQRLAGRLVLLVIDEAQNLGLGALEELRMLSNLETEKSKLLQIVLVGQPNLRDTLGAPELEQLRQRITVSYHLPPLDAEETFKYINHRLAHAALGAPMRFPRQATDLIHARSGGVPRIINVICDATLVFGYAEERRDFDARVILEVLDELETTGVLPPASAMPAIPRREAGTPPATVAAPQPFSSAAARPAAPEPIAVATSGAATAALSAAVEETRRELERREALVRQREAELAEQRRVLAEEYRLLRAQRSAPAAAIESGPVRFRDHEPSRRGAGGAPAAYETGTFWRRLKRFMLGVSPS